MWSQLHWLTGVNNEMVVNQWLQLVFQNVKFCGYMQLKGRQIRLQDAGGFDFRLIWLLLYFQSCDCQCHLVSTQTNVIITIYLFIYLSEMSVSENILCWMVWLLVNNELEMAWQEAILLLSRGIIPALGWRKRGKSCDTSIMSPGIWKKFHSLAGHDRLLWFSFNTVKNFKCHHKFIIVMRWHSQRCALNIQVILDVTLSCLVSACH